MWRHSIQNMIICQNSLKIHLANYESQQVKGCIGDWKNGYVLKYDKFTPRGATRNNSKDLSISDDLDNFFEVVRSHME